MLANIILDSRLNNEKSTYVYILSTKQCILLKKKKKKEEEEEEGINYRGI